MNFPEGRHIGVIAQDARVLQQRATRVLLAHVVLGERKARAEEIHADLIRSDSRAYDKRFDCEPRDSASDG